MNENSKEFLFIFGFEDPIEFEGNKENETDFESSRAIWILAQNPNEALQWGKIFAEKYVSEIFAEAGVTGYSWGDSKFAYWIEEHPESIADVSTLERIPKVRVGHYALPNDFDR